MDSETFRDVVYSFVRLRDWLNENYSFYVPTEQWKQMQRARRRGALSRARNVTWMMGNRHIWMPKPTKAQKVRRQQCRLRQPASP